MKTKGKNVVKFTGHRLKGHTKEEIRKRRSERKNVLLLVQAIVIHGFMEDDLEFVKQEVKRLGIKPNQILDVIAETRKGLAEGTLEIIGADDNLNREVYEVFAALSKNPWPSLEREGVGVVFCTRDRLPKFPSMEALREARKDLKKAK
ncbi:MAG: hypothetical protein AAB791_03005 [Patescibacteria group bacterium]